jgi:hypothetical protein
VVVVVVVVDVVFGGKWLVVVVVVVCDGDGFWCVCGGIWFYDDKTIFHFLKVVQTAEGFLSHTCMYTIQGAIQTSLDKCPTILRDKKDFF